MLASNKKVFLKLLVLFFIVISIFSINSFAIVNQTSDFYVNDYANLLNSDTKNYIINTNKDLYNKTGAQIVVVTVPSLEGNSIEEYATELFRDFGIGDKAKNNGVLMLLALEEREFRIEVGYGLEGCLPDGKTGRIQDEYIIPYLRNNNWDDGIKNGYSAILQVVSNEYNISLNIETPQTSQLVENSIYPSDRFVVLMLTVMPPITSIFGYIINETLKKDKKVIISIIYMIVLMIITVSKVKETGMVIFVVILNLIGLLFGIKMMRSDGVYSSGKSESRSYSSRSSFGSSSSSSHSSSRSFGGGGSSGGGGSTRKF